MTEDTFCYTRITNEEMELVEKKERNNMMTPSTRHLVTYKALFTEKYVEALNTEIEVLSIDCMHKETNATNTSEEAINMRLNKFENALFSTSGVSSPLYSNYFILLGAKFNPNVSIYTDFLVCDDTSSDKYHFCIKYGIPVIKTDEIFSSDYSKFKKVLKYDAISCSNHGMFYDKIFYIDDKLPKKIFNRLKRLIVQHDGTRFPTPSSDVNCILSSRNNAYQFKDKAFYYQYVFDCVDANALLYEEFYRIHLDNNNIEYNILNGCVIACDSNVDEIKNKVIALDGVFQKNADMRTTHLITDENVKSKQYKCVKEEWLNDCIMNMKRLDEKKYKPKKSSRTKQNKLSVQITGIEDETTRSKLEEYFSSRNIRMVHSDKYENTTHLIMGKPNTTEKFLGALVNGCWILRSSILEEEDFSTACWLKHEWVATNNESSSTNRIVASIKKWRTRIQERSCKPFHKWVVKLYAPEKKYKMFSDVIVQGGGKMSKDNKYTHVFVDKNYVGETEEKTKYSTAYIFEYLFR